MQAFTMTSRALLAVVASAWCGSGIVVDSLGVPLENVKVTRVSDGVSTSTDAAGSWALPSPTGVGAKGVAHRWHDRQLVMEGSRLSFRILPGRGIDGRRPMAVSVAPVDESRFASRAFVSTDSVRFAAKGWVATTLPYDPASSNNAISLKMSGLPGMVPIRGGFVSLGSASQYNNLPHVARLAGFWIDTVETTQRLYDSLMGYNPSYHKACPTCPVEQVTWLDALRFCNARSRAEGLPEAYDLSSPDSMTWTWNPRSGGYRLPTDAEWERAARAGSSDDWYWGQVVNTGTVIQYAWHDLNSGDSTHPVGKLLPNAFGLYDVSGNVTEWVWDVFKELKGDTLYYPKSTPSAVERKSARGGDFSNYVVEIHSTRRLPALPTSKWLALGFRCARGVMP